MSNKLLLKKYVSNLNARYKRTNQFSLQASMLNKQKGASLLEVMISVLVLSIGLLGIAGLQSSTVRNTMSAQQRTAAITMATSAAERIRAYYMVNRNLSSITFQEFNMPKTCQTAPSGSGFFAQTKQQFHADLISNFGASDLNCIMVDFVAASNSIRISVFWDDSRATAGDSQESLNYEVRVRP